MSTSAITLSIVAICGHFVVSMTAYYSENAIDEGSRAAMVLKTIGFHR